MKHSNYVKAAKDLNAKAGSKLKVAAVKGDVLKKSIQDLTPTLVDFDFGKLEESTLNVLDDLNCEMPEINDDLPIADDLKEKVTPINEFITTEALIEAAEDVGDVLGYPKDDIEKFKKLTQKKMLKELQSMANAINEPYEDNGKEVVPNDTPDMFKPDTIKVFEANSIKVKWNEVEEKTEEKSEKETPKPKTKVQDKKKEQLQLAFHEYANLFPESDEETVHTIVRDMNENGFRPDRPIILFGGKIADGRTRYKCAQIAEVDAIYTNFEGTKEELFKHVIALNLKRRHLTPAQKASLGAELLPEFEKQGKEKQKAGGKGKKTDKAFRAAEEAAKVAGSTPGAVSAAKKVKEKAPEKFEEMKKGKKTITAAKRETEEKTELDKFNEAERMMKAKLKMAQKAIQEFFDAAELAEVKEIENENDLVFIDDTIRKILD